MKQVIGILILVCMLAIANSAGAQQQPPTTDTQNQAVEEGPTPEVTAKAIVTQLEIFRHQADRLKEILDRQSKKYECPRCKPSVQKRLIEQYNRVSMAYEKAL